VEDEGRLGRELVGELLDPAHRVSGDPVVRDEVASAPVGDDDAGDVAEPRIGEDAELGVDLGDPHRRPASGPQAAVHHVQHLAHRVAVACVEDADCLGGRLGGTGAVTEAVRDDDPCAAVDVSDREVVTRHRLAFHHPADTADRDPGRSARGTAQDARDDDRPVAGRRVQVERVGKAHDGAQADPGAAGRRVPVLERLPLVGDARPGVERHKIDADRPLAFDAADEEAAALAGVLDQVARKLGGDECDPAAAFVVEPEVLRIGSRLAPRLTTLAALRDADERARRDAHPHRVAVIRVPWPGVESISNSLTRRRAPPSPSPRPPPVVKPS
jgi:hypothetical protein